MVSSDYSKWLVATVVAMTALTVGNAAQVAPARTRTAPHAAAVIEPGFRILLPTDIKPETAKVFFALEPSGVLADESVRTRAGVRDYSVPTAGSPFLRLLIYAPGYQMITAEFRDAQLGTATPYTPPLVKLPVVSLSGNLVDSSGKPVRNQVLDLSYELFEAVPYFCGNCMLDGQVPTMAFGRTRTDRKGAFTFKVPDVRADPFFQRYAHALSGFRLRAMLPGGLADDVLRPSMLAAPAMDKKPVTVVFTDHGMLSGRLGPAFLRQNEIADLSSYRRGFGEVGDRRLGIELRAEYDFVSENSSGHLYYAIELKPDGTFDGPLPSGTYDLTLSVLGPDAAVRKILIEAGVLIRERQRIVLNRP